MRPRLRHVLSFVLAAGTLGCGAATPHDASVETRGEGQGCSSDAECRPGLACCYPCGIDGCENACLPVRPGEGCPALP